MNLFFDCETTGLIIRDLELTDPAQPRIVQLAAILADDEGEVLEEYDVIFKPDGYTITEESSAIHGITHEMAEQKGIPARQALEGIEKLAARAKIAIAHNMSFDMAMVNREAFLLEYEMGLRALPRYCTMKEGTPITKIKTSRGYKWPKLIELYRHFFGCDFDGAHNALHDVRATLKCYLEMKKLTPLAAGFPGDYQAPIF